MTDSYNSSNTLGNERSGQTGTGSSGLAGSGTVSGVNPNELTGARADALEHSHHGGDQLGSVRADHGDSRGMDSRLGGDHHTGTGHTSHTGRDATLGAGAGAIGTGAHEKHHHGDSTSRSGLTGSGMTGGGQHAEMYGGSSKSVDMPDATGRHGQFGEMGEKSASLKDRLVGAITGHKPAEKDTQRFEPAGTEGESKHHDKHRAEEGAVAGAGAGALASHEHNKHDKHHDTRDKQHGTHGTHDKHDKHRAEEGALAGAGVGVGAGTLAGREHERGSGLDEARERGAGYETGSNPHHGLTSSTGNDVAIGGRAPVSDPIRGDPALMSTGGERGTGLGSSTTGTGLGSTTTGLGASHTGSGLGSSSGTGLGSSSTSTGLGSSTLGQGAHDQSNLSAGQEGLIHGHHTTMIGEVLDPHLGQSSEKRL
ncbi:hypothetical protein LTR78_008194 [Recurvomyces mirabilis]|uniref:Uncharacterized protein n=1 Tax=Recurvomyces mirabilis TaxID=574656 RepID=A0AAE0TTJ4_9PEZI|nr:hypothetical protein LTR78_008194 [Recurvomyces mirabilis]KAK5150607.1 hypothetical protein LTS14_009890 [Recurvomyces mirabilis]